MINREQFIRDAWELDGRPFLHQGVDPKIGLDCINAPAYLCRRQGVDLPFEIPLTYHANAHDYDLIESTLKENLIAVSFAAAQAGDLYLFKPRKIMRHLAIRLNDDDPPLLLHPSSQPRKGFPQGRISVEPFADRWPLICLGVFRIPWDKW